MTQTATRTSSARPAATPTPVVHEIDLGRSGAAVINQCANARQVRLEAEHIENPLKERRMALIVKAMGGELPEGEKVVVKAMKVVRGTISWRPRPRVVDFELMLQAYPECYAACVSEGGVYPQYDPA